MRKVKHREHRWCPQSHRAGKWWKQYPHPGSLAPEIIIVTPTLFPFRNFFLWGWPCDSSSWRAYFHIGTEGSHTYQHITCWLVLVLWITKHDLWNYFVTEVECKWVQLASLKRQGDFITCLKKVTRSGTICEFENRTESCFCSFPSSFFRRGHWTESIPGSSTVQSRSPISIIIECWSKAI